MGMAGIIAGAWGGAAKGIGDMAQGYIDNERKTDLARAQSDIEEQRQLRVMEAQERTRQAGRQADARFDAGEGADLAVQREGKLTPVMADRAGALATATGNAQTAVEKARGNDKDYLRAKNNEAEAGVTSVQRTTAAAAATTAAAHAKLATAQAAEMGVKTDLARISLDDAKKVSQLYDDWAVVNDDTTLDDKTRAARLAKIQQQVALIKAKTGQAGGRDPELDTTTREVTSIGPNGEQIKTTTKEARRPGATAGGADPLGLRTGQGEGKPAAAQPGAAGVIAAKAPALQESSAPKPDAFKQRIMDDMDPLVQKMREARARLRAVGPSGDSLAQARYASEYTKAWTDLASVAQERLGNGADGFLASLD